jgi:hypothetical protein
MVYPVRALASSSAPTVAAYLRELPPDRRAVVGAVRQLVLEHLPKGYEEAMNWGMITYQVPRKRFAGTANLQPLCYAALAAQKNYYSLYLMSLYVNPRELESFRAAFKAAGKKLDRGKSCVRFRRLEDLELPAVARLVAATRLEDFVKVFEASRAGGAGGAGKLGTKKGKRR